MYTKKTCPIQYRMNYFDSWISWNCIGTKNLTETIQYYYHMVLTNGISNWTYMYSVSSMHQWQFSKTIQYAKWK